MARELREAGWPRARALTGGWAALRESGCSMKPAPVVQPAALQRDG